MTIVVNIRLIGPVAERVVEKIEKSVMAVPLAGTTLGIANDNAIESYAPLSADCDNRCDERIVPKVGIIVDYDGAGRR